MNSQKLILAYLTLAIALTGLAEDRKPNVLFIMSDDLNTALSGFGHPQCKTPELDKLADAGVRFENMHCQSVLRIGPSGCGVHSMHVGTGIA